MAVVCDKAFDKGYFFILTVDDEKYHVQCFFVVVLICTPTPVLTSEGF